MGLTPSQTPGSVGGGSAGGTPVGGTPVRDKLAINPEDSLTGGRAGIGATPLSWDCLRII